MYLVRMINQKYHVDDLVQEVVDLEYQVDDLVHKWSIGTAKSMTLAKDFRIF